MHDVRQSSLIDADTLQLLSEFTAMVKRAHRSNEFYFYIQQTEVDLSDTHKAQQTRFRQKCHQQQQPDVPDEINSMGI